MKSFFLVSSWLEIKRFKTRFLPSITAKGINIIAENIKIIENNQPYQKILLNYI